MLPYNYPEITVWGMYNQNYVSLLFNYLQTVKAVLSCCYLLNTQFRLIIYYTDYAVLCSCLKTVNQ